jgi:hypothetical protein
VLPRITGVEAPADAVAGGAQAEPGFGGAEHPQRGRAANGYGPGPGGGAGANGNAGPNSSAAPNGNGSMRGRAAVVPRPAPAPDPSGVTPLPQPRRPRPPLSVQMRVLKLGGGWSWFGAIFAFVCWSIWAVANRSHNLVAGGFAFGLVLLVGVGLFALLRVIGRYVLVRWLGRERRTARLSHMGTALYLVAVGIAYLEQTPWVASLSNWFAR